MDLHILPHLHARIAELEQLVSELEHHADFDIPRRCVLERRWPTVAPGTSLVFFDLDGLNALNAKYAKHGGYAEVNRRIRESFAHVRQDTQVYAYQDGDEFVAVCPTHDAYGLAQRIQAALRSNDLSASFAIVPVADCLQSTVCQAVAKLKAAGRGRRGKGRRGFIVGGPVTTWQAFWMRCG